jgi:prepilin-type N-terminal cleavage/methylation domain-containing protein
VSVDRPSARPRVAERGFSFLEVLMAMSILLVGSIGVLALFTLGVNDMVQRRIDARMEQVRNEVVSLAHGAVSESGPDEVLKKKIETALSVPDYSVRLEFTASRFDGPSVLAHATIFHQGQPVRVLPPIPLTRMVLVPSKPVRTP